MQQKSVRIFSYDIILNMNWETWTCLRGNMVWPHPPWIIAFGWKLGTTKLLKYKHKSEKSGVNLVLIFASFINEHELPPLMLWSDPCCDILYCKGLQFWSMCSFIVVVAVLSFKVALIMLWLQCYITLLYFGIYDGKVPLKWKLNFYALYVPSYLSKTTCLFK